MSDKKFNINDRRKSFLFAFSGLKAFFQSQHNARIHLLAAVVVIAGGCFLELNMNEWCWIIIAIAIVFVTEMLNTAIEFLSDVVSPQFHPQIKKVKDIAAAAVLISALAAVGIGLVVFLPKILAL